MRVVVEGAGRPVGFARVWVQPWDEDPPERHGSPFRFDACTSREGEARLDVDSGLELDLFVEILSPDRGRAEVRVGALAPGEERQVTVELALAPREAFFGCLFDVNSGGPVVGAQVVIPRGPFQLGRDGYEGASDPRAENRSDALGCFQLIAPYPRLDSVWRGLVLARGYEPLWFRMDPGHGSSATALELPVRPGSSLAISALDPSGSPRARVVFRLSLSTREARRHGAWSASQLDWEQETDAAGKLVFESLPHGRRLELLVREPGPELRRLPDFIVLAQGEQREITWTPGGEARLTGVLVDSEDQPVAGVELWLVRGNSQSPVLLEPLETVHARATSDSQGRFAFSRVALGAWILGPAPGDESPYSPLARPIRVDEEGTIDLRLSVAEALEIRGRVVRATGAPAYAGVHAYSREGHGASHAMTDDQGGFRLRGLPGGDYEIYAEDRRGDEAWSPTEVVEAGESGGNGITLRLRQAGELRVEVVGATEAPRERVLVSFTSLRDGRHFSLAGSHWQTTSLARLPPGEAVVFASTKDGRAGWAPVLVAPDSVQDVQVELRPAALLDIGLGDSATARVVEVFLNSGDGRRVQVFGRALDPLTSVSLPVPPGRIRATLREGTSALVSAELTLGEGERGKLTLSEAP